MHSPSRRGSIFAASLAVTALVAGIPFNAASEPAKLDRLVQRRASRSSGSSRVIVRGTEGTSRPRLQAVLQEAGGTPGKLLRIINAQVARVPNAALNKLAKNPLIEHIALDRAVAGAMELTSKTVGAGEVRERLGYDGSGVGVAIVDSGVTRSHDDLNEGDRPTRIAHFVDLVNGRDAAYDDYGHGTHVAGIVAGSGFDSRGARAGIAPGAQLIVLKALDAGGRGRISDVIAALDYAVAHKEALNIRIVNLSLSAAVIDRSDIDPLTLAAERAVTAGLVVVAAAGNAGRNAEGVTQYGGISAPGNAPWVITVGAASHMGTPAPGDDIVAPFSSRGPTAIEYGAKPDIVAPGVGVESLSAPESALYASMSPFLLAGAIPTPFLPYLSLSGTSMAAPVVTGAIALMLQANPALTPNAVKVILEYTSRPLTRYDALTQGAGFLNAGGAVAVARFLASGSQTDGPSSPDWSGRIIWGTHAISAARVTDFANAWSQDVGWGAVVTPDEANVFSSTAPNVVWGSICGGSDCTGPWTIGGPLLRETDAATVVWGSTTTSGVWGTTIVWGSSCSDPACQPLIWSRE